LKAVPPEPLAVVELVIAGVLAVSVIVKVVLPVPLALVALMVGVKVPLTLGVPVMAPVLVFTLSPVGNPVALKLVGMLLAVIW